MQEAGSSPQPIFQRYVRIEVVILSPGDDLSYRHGRAQGRRGWPRSHCLRCLGGEEDGTGELVTIRDIRSDAANG